MNRAAVSAGSRAGVRAAGIRAHVKSWPEWLAARYMAGEAREVNAKLTGGRLSRKPGWHSERQRPTSRIPDPLDRDLPTHGDAMDKKEMIDKLNGDLAGELGAIIQYLTYAAKATGPYRPQLSQFFLAEVA